MKILTLTMVVGASFLTACAGSYGASAETLAGVVKTMRDYDMRMADGSAPARPLRFYIGENSAFATCGICLCVTGVMTGRYPDLGMRPTSASPTFSCEKGSAEFEADSALLEQFFAMTTARVDGEILIFSNEDQQEMVFQLGGAELSPL